MYTLCVYICIYIYIYTYSCLIALPDPGALNSCMHLFPESHTGFTAYKHWERAHTSAGSRA